MKLKQLIFLLFATVFFQASLSQQVPSDQAEFPEAQLFQVYLDGLISAQMTDYHLGGISFSLIKDGEPFMSTGYGYADLENRIAVDPSLHLFRPGSVSKLFTWTAVMQLVEQGKIDLDGDVNQYLTQFLLPNNFDKPITMKHIMTHAAGFEDGAMGYLFSNSADDLIPLADSLASHIPAQVREPGTYSSYSNFATAVAGLIVANISEMSFEEYVVENIFTPLEMNHSTFEEPLPANLQGDMSIGYLSRSGGVRDGGFEYIKNFGPAGALSSTADDMTKFMLAHVNGGAYQGNRILGEDTVRLMHSRIFAHHPRAAGMAHGFYELFRNGERFVTHGGDTIAFHSQLVIQPETGFGFYISFNAEQGAQARQAIVNGVIDYFFEYDHSPREIITLDGSDERIASIVGGYRVNRRSYTKLEGASSILSDYGVGRGDDGEILFLGGRYSEIEPFIFQEIGSQEIVIADTNSDGTVARMLLAAAPIMVFDKLAFYQMGGNHLMVIGLAILAAIVVLVNAWRNRRLSAAAAYAQLARRGLMASSALLLLFLLCAAIVAMSTDANTLLYDFPTGGMKILLIFPIAIALSTLCNIALTFEVWRADDCSVWQRIRYTLTVTIFATLVLIFWYWNLLGWNYF